MIHSPELADWIDAMFFRPRSNHFLTSVANSGTQAVETKGRWRVLRIIYCHWPGRYCRRAYNIVTGHTILSPAGHILSPGIYCHRPGIYCRRAYIVTGRAYIASGIYCHRPGRYCRRAYIVIGGADIVAGHILSPATIFMCRERRHIYCRRAHIVAGDNIYVP